MGTCSTGCGIPVSIYHNEVHISRRDTRHAIHSLVLGRIYAFLTVGLTLIYKAERSLYCISGRLYYMGVCDLVGHTIQ